MLTLTREQLYEQVWSKPTIELAKEYGVSDVAIAKVCKKHNIPKPPLGYWAKLQHGHKVRRPALPRIDDPNLQTIRISPIPEDERHRPISPETKDKVRAERSEESRVVVSGRLDRPHPLVERTAQSLCSAQADECGIVRPKAKGCLDVAVGKDSIDRAMRIMDALVKAIESRGMRISTDEGQKFLTIVEVDGEPLDVRLSESVGERERQLTPQQKQENARLSYFKPHATHEKYPKGLLVLSFGFENDYPPRHRCSELDGRRLEDRLNSFIAAMYRGVERVRTWRRGLEEMQRWMEEDRKCREEAERQRQEAERRKRAEEARVNQLIAAASAWETAQRVRAYVAAVEKVAVGRNGEVDPESELGRWINWARRTADQIDPIH